jgi:hypothetical protein
VVVLAVVGCGGDAVFLVAVCFGGGGFFSFAVLFEHQCSFIRMLFLFAK